MKQLDWKFGTNSSFNSSFSFPWKGSAPALLVGSSTPVPELQFLRRLKITPAPNNREASLTLKKYPLIKKKLPVAVTSKELTSAANNGLQKSVINSTFFPLRFRYT